MKKSELQQIIKKETQKIIKERKQSSYNDNVLSKMKELAIKMNLGKGFNDNFFKWFSTTEDFKKMIEVSKMNNQSELAAAKSIMSIWR